MAMKREDLEVAKTWQIVEQHGLWWAYEGELPPLEAFQTHGRSRHLPILGPYPSRVFSGRCCGGIRDPRGAEGLGLELRASKKHHAQV